MHKDSNTFRVLCLGGSTTLSSRLPEEQRYPHVLQIILQKHYPSKKIEVLNAGMHWYTTKHSLINYVTNCKHWKPDLVIVMHGINDLSRSFSPPKWAVGKYKELWTHFYGASIYGAKPPTFEQYLYRQFCEKVFDSWYSELRLKKRLGIEVEVEYPLQKYVAINMFEKHLSSIVKYVKSDKLDILLISQPSLYKTVMDEEEQKALWIGKAFCYTKRNPIQIEFPSYNSLLGAMRAFNRIVEEVATKEGAIFVNAAERIPKNLKNFIDDCHYKAPGAKLLAETITETIIKLELIEKR